MSYFSFLFVLGSWAFYIRIGAIINFFKIQKSLSIYILSPFIGTLFEVILKNEQTMKKTIFLLCFLIPALAFSQQKLEKLVGERKQLHEQWKASESKKSGIFGHRTKKDMIETNNWLERIVQKDNQIIDELELLKNIETTEIKYENEDYKFIAQKQEQDIGKLKRALIEKDEQIEAEKSNKRTYEWTTLIFFITNIILGYLFYKSKFRG